MYLSDFSYHLPEHLIAQTPLPQRSASRLLCLNKLNGAICHQPFLELPNLLSTDDLLIFNDTKVIPARLFGCKKTGGKVELLIERILQFNTATAQIKSNKPIKIGSTLIFADQIEAEVVGRHNDLVEIYFHITEPLLNVLHKVGHLPLPPYVKRVANQNDLERYQTIFGTKDGAVAAPTAGLHFDEGLLAQLSLQNIQTSFVTLHVGAGTFKPVTTENILAHKMHPEYVEVSTQTCELIERTKQKNGRVIAVGTTSVRALETAARGGKLQAFCGDSTLFIYPGFAFECVDAMITNFHLPKSTLLMLVCAFAGKEAILSAYQQAIAHEYRFYSYGDAMFIY